jgi:hypothetical protein
VSARDPDLEMAFVRSLSVHGTVLSGDLSAEDKRERIRVAILMQRRENTELEPGLTYAQAFRRCYGTPIELRKLVRDRFGRPMQFAHLGGEGNEGESDESGEDTDEDAGDRAPGQHQRAGQ